MKQKFFKRIKVFFFAIILSAVLLFSLSACGTKTTYQTVTHILCYAYNGNTFVLNDKVKVPFPPRPDWGSPFKSKYHAFDYEVRSRQDIQKDKSYLVTYQNEVCLIQHDSRDTTEYYMILTTDDPGNGKIKTLVLSGMMAELTIEKDGLFGGLIILPFQYLKNPVAVYTDYFIAIGREYPLLEGVDFEQVMAFYESLHCLAIDKTENSAILTYENLSETSSHLPKYQINYQNGSLVYSIPPK